MELILSSNFPLEGNDRLMPCIKNTMETGSLKTAFVSALQQIGQYEKYKSCLAAHGLKDVEYFEIGEEMNSERAEFLSLFNILYLHGGDPFKILLQIRRSGFDRFLRGIKDSDKIIIGTSGSTMALSKGVSLLSLLYPKAKKTKSRGLSNATRGLGLFPDVALPHFERYERRKAVELIKKYSKQNPVYAIYDGSAIVYEENKVRPIGPVVVYQNGLELTLR
jgi:peptidase E